MGCNCKVFETVLGIVLLIVAIWPNLLTEGISNWIIIIGAVLLIIHACMCKNCGAWCYPNEQGSKDIRKKRKQR